MKDGSGSGKGRTGQAKEGVRSGLGSRSDRASDQAPGKTHEERAQTRAAAAKPPSGDVQPKSASAGIGNRPDPSPGDREEPGVARPDWPHPFRGEPAPAADPATTGVGERRDPGAPPAEVGDEAGPEFGATKSGPSTGGARQGGEGRDTQERGTSAGGDWKNARQGFGGGHPGQSFGNQPTIAEGGEATGDRLEPGGSPAAGAEAGSVHVAREEKGR